MKRTTSATAVVLLAATLGLTACTPSLDLTCAEYLQKSAPDQRSIAQEYLKEVVGNKDPSAPTTTATQTALIGYCHLRPDQQISHISL